MYMEGEPSSLGEGVNSDSETCLPTSLAGTSSLPRPPCQNWHSFSRSPSPATDEKSPNVIALEQGRRGLGASREFTGHSFCSSDQGERPKDLCGSCHVNLVIPM